jgi:molybdopterin-guanine dinucleotide biosynthesis protein A
MTGIILAGGGNSRMGTDKSFLKIKGKPLIERTLRVFNELFDETIIVTNTPEIYVLYDAILVGDLIKKRGPMAGIYSGLLNAKDTYSFVVACDMPFLNKSLISFMMGLAEGVDMIIPRVSGMVEPLHAIYSKSCLTHIEKHLKDERWGLSDLPRDCKVRYIEEVEISKIDPEMKSFININTPDDLEKVMAREG